MFNLFSRHLSVLGRKEPRQIKYLLSLSETLFRLVLHVEFGVCVPIETATFPPQAKSHPTKQTQTMSPIAEPDLAQAEPLPQPGKAQSPPSHPGLLHVYRSDKAFGSGAISLVSLPPGSVFARIESDVIKTVPVRRYTTVQRDCTTHIELNSDLVYCNHSCDPTVVFDMGKLEVRVVDDKPLKSGDQVTFFYPSTEWEMDQPFDCTCGSPKCQKKIAGAKHMERSVLDEYWLNEHVVDLLKQDGR
jgi:hypothetical protein